jgi:hypothetical protein
VLARRKGALDEKYLAAAHTFIEAGPKLIVSEALQGEVAQGLAISFGDFAAEVLRSAAGEYFNVRVHRKGVKAKMPAGLHKASQQAEKETQREKAKGADLLP